MKTEQKDMLAIGKALEQIKEYAHKTNADGAIMEELYYLLNNADWKDEMYQLEFTMEHLMQLITIPEVNNCLFQINKRPQDIAAKLQKLLWFFRRLQDDDCMTELALYVVDNLGYSKSDEELRNLEEEYKIKNMITDYSKAIQR